MANLLPESESTEVEGRVYINPQTGVDEANTFIENLRQTQQANTQQIAQDTRNLGTDVPSSLGGLGGATGYWTSRYQTPQTASAIADLRTAAQAQALNEALANEQAVWKNRYQQAYRNYQKRQYDKANKPATPANPTTNNQKGDVEKKVTTPQDFFGVPDTIVSETDTHYIYTDPKTGEQTKVSKDYMNKIYDKNGNITDDGMVILDTRRMLGL